MNIVDRFELTELLGHEGRVEVYLGHDPHLDRKLTIRVANFSELDPSYREEHDERMRKASELRNTHLTTVLDFGRSDGVDFLATNFIEGHSLTKVARTNRGIEPKQVALLVGKLALAVNQMHAAELVHGYLSPDSVILEKSGEPVIVDLGFAPELRDGEKDGAWNFRSGFAAPEVKASGGGDIRPQSDVYSLAAIGYFVLTGRSPRSAEDTEDPTFLEGLEEVIATQFKESFSKALAADAADRFQSARELAGVMDQLYRITPKINPASSKRKSAGPDAGAVKYDQFDFQEIEDSHVVHLHDASVLSMEGLAQTKQELFEMVERFKPKRLIINFAGVRFCSSETVGVLIQLNSKLKNGDTHLYLCGMRDSIREVFRVLNLDGTVFEIRGTVHNALKSVE